MGKRILNAQNMSYNACVGGGFEHGNFVLNGVSQKICPNWCVREGDFGIPKLCPISRVWVCGEGRI